MSRWSRRQERWRVLPRTVPSSALALLACCAFTATACATGYPRPGKAELHSGYFSAGFEVSSFEPCGADERWWVLDGADLHHRYRDTGVADYEPVYAEFMGTVSERGVYGHMGAYQRQVAVERVVTVEREGGCD